MSCGVVPAVSTFPSAGVTDVCVAVTLTGATAGEAPLARLAVRAPTPSGSLPALAPACHWVTLVAQRTLGVAVTGSTTIHSKAVGSWGTLVTVLTNDIGFTSTLASNLFTVTTEGTLRIALTRQSTIMNDG